MSSRASIFDDAIDDLSDLTHETTGAVIDPEVMSQLASRQGFHSRSPVVPAAEAGAEVDKAASPRTPRRQVRRETRSESLSVRIKPSYGQRFIACLDKLGPEYSQADGIEAAITALELQLGIRVGEG